MAKLLRVIDPFFTVDAGDVFEYSNDSKMYVSRRKEEFYKTDSDHVNEIKSSYNAEFMISKEYAQELIESGYLEEMDEKKNDFVNIFDEIDNLLTKYKNELKTIEADTVDLPACVKVEREVVLTNLVTLLEHLKSLKK